MRIATTPHRKPDFFKARPVAVAAGLADFALAGFITCVPASPFAPLVVAAVIAQRILLIN
jgi:hypothetical protein